MKQSVGFFAGLHEQPDVPQDPVSPGDRRGKVRDPDFYWKRISPHLSEACAYLNVTAAGRQWIANLHSHVFCAEHSLALMGPER